MEHRRRTSVAGAGSAADHNASESTRRLEEALVAIEGGTQSALERMLDMLAEPGLSGSLPEDARRHMADTVHAIFEQLQRQSLSAADTLADADADAARNDLDAQSHWFRVKLEAQRTAAKVTLENQMATMAAKKQQQLQTQTVRAIHPIRFPRQRPHC